MQSCAQNLPKRRTVLTLRFQLIGVHVNMMHGQALCSDSAGEVLGRGEAGSARGRAGSASCPCVIQSSNAEHEDPARSSHPREVDVQRKTPFCSFGLGRVRASMRWNPERLKKERLNVLRGGRARGRGPRSKHCGINLRVRRTPPSHGVKP